MKKLISTSFSETIGGVRLFREDIEEILFRLENQSFNVEIENSNTVYDDLNEVIKQLGNEPQSLIISAKRRSNLWENVTIGIEKNNVRISSSGSDTMYSFGFELKDIFKNKVPSYYITSSSVFNRGTLYFLSAIPLFMFMNWETKIHPYPWMILCHLFFLIFFLVSMFLNRHSGGLTLERRHEYGFWQKNKDKILLLIIGSIIGSIFTYFTKKC